jgi:hypothetical protein
LVLFVLPVCSQDSDTKEDPVDFPDFADLLVEKNSFSGDSNAFSLSSSWFDLSSAQQEIVIDIVRTQQKRRMKVRPFLMAFTRALYFVVNSDLSNSNRVTEFLEAGRSTLKTGASPSNILQYFKTCTNLFRYNSLYYGRNSKIFIESGSISIAHEEDMSDYAPDMLLDHYEEEEVLVSDSTLDPDFESEDDWDDDWDDEGDEWNDYDDNENVQNYEESQVNILDFGEDDLDASIGYHGPKILVENADLLIETPYDTTYILGTQGELGIFHKRFSGSSGTMNWEKHNFGPEVYAELGKYDFLVSRPVFSSENSKMHFPQFFDKAIDGVFTFRSLSRKKGGNNYPKFHSYGSNFKYKTIRKEVSFRGGFNLIGKTIHSAGMDGRNSVLEVSYKGEKTLKTISRRFFIKDSIVYSYRGRVSLYLFEDSLTHPGLSLKYGLDDLTLWLYWEKGINRYLPMLDSYHRIEITGDRVWYTLGDNQIYFGIISGRSEVPMKIKSDENFDGQEYNRMKSLYGFNPINTVNAYYKKTKKSSFNYRELAEAYNLDPKIVFGAMKGIGGRGYIDFDKHTGEVGVNKKTIHSFKSRMKKEDYDNIEIYSTVPTGRNGYIDLDSGIFWVFGVRKEIISRGLGVYFMPDSGTVKIYKDRDFNFDGRLVAGNYEIIGKNFGFNYSSFLFKINQLDSINFSITDDSSGQTSSQQILGGSLKNTAGTLWLNEIDNKSGLKSNPQYPILDISAPTYVFFDSKNVLGGAYNKEVYFEIPSFKIDSVESDNPNVIHLAGIFHTGGMIPELETKLVVMPDLSLGFEYDVPEDGFEIYESSAKFYDHLTLDRGGLYGSGILTYMASLVESDTFVFYQDSLYMDHGSFEVTQGDFAGISFPHAKTNSFTASFHPKREELIIRSTDEEIELYEGIAMLDGTGIITPFGMKGSGIVKTGQTKTFSENYLFQENKFTGHHSKFKIETSFGTMPGLMAIDVRMTFDFLENTAMVEPEVEGDASLEMPILQMKTSIPVGVWNLETHMFTMTKPDEIDIENSYFYSTNPELDSLAFNADSAVYDVESGTLNASGVPGLYVADAYIMPGDGNLVISQEGEVEPLENASILMDQNWEYHFLTDASVEIFSAKEFDGDAIYKYDNGAGDTMNIVFEGLHQEQVGYKRSEIDTSTIGLSEIFPEDNFFISPNILFQGNVDLYANEEFLHFNGEIRLDLRHSDEFNDWMAFKYVGAPEDIIIEIKEAEGEDEEQLLTTGLHYDPSEEELYYSFISSKRFAEDEDIFKSVGLLGVDPEEGRFEMGSRKKLEEGSIEGNLFVYDDSLSEISFEGEFSFSGVDGYMGMKSYGRGRANLDSANYSFQTLSMIDFPMPNAAVNEMGKDLSETTGFADNLLEALEDPGIQYNRLAQVIGESGAENFEEQLYTEYLPLYLASSKLSKGILISDLKFAWHDGENAFFNYDTLGLASVMKNDINSRIKSYLEIRKGYDGSVVNLYLEILPDCWYYISYGDGSVRTFSSNYVFNDIITAKATQGEVKEGSAELALANKFEVLEYITHFNNTYLNNSITEDDLKLDVNKPELESGIMAEQQDKEFDDGGFEEDYDEDWGDDEWGEEDEIEPEIDGEEIGAGAVIESQKESPLEEEPLELENQGIGQDQEEEDDWGGDDWGEEDEGEADGNYTDNQTETYVGAPPAKKEKTKKEKKQKEPRQKREKKEKEADYFPVEDEDSWSEEWNDDEDNVDPVILSRPKEEENEDDDWGGDDWGEEEEGVEEDDFFDYGEDEDSSPAEALEKKEEKPVIVTKPKEEEPIEKKEEEPLIITQPEKKEIEEDDFFDFGDEDETSDEDLEEKDEEPVITSPPEKKGIEESDDEWDGDDWGEDESSASKTIEGDEEKPVIITQPKEEESFDKKEEEPVIISQPEEKEVEEDDFFDYGDEDESSAEDLEEKKEGPVIISEPGKKEIEESDDEWGGDESSSDEASEDKEEKPEIVTKPEEDPIKEKEKEIEEDDFFDYGDEDESSPEVLEEKPVIISKPKEEEKPKVQEEKKPLFIEEEEEEEDDWGDDWGEEEESGYEDEGGKKEKEIKSRQKEELNKEKDSKKDEKKSDDPKKEKLDEKKNNKTKKEKKPIPPAKDKEDDDWDDDDDDGF